MVKQLQPFKRVRSTPIFQGAGRRWVRGLALACTPLLALTACGGTDANGDIVGQPSSMDITLIGFNDLHGNLEPPRLSVNASGPSGTVAVPAGGVAYLAGAIATLKAANPHHAVISAGDMVGASPLVSALFLDEPTIDAVNRMQIDFNAVGNHEFDKGWRELLRLANGGCEKNTARQPCQLNPSFAGANFGFLAANTRREDGQKLLPATGIKRFSQDGATVTVGFIGLTLKTTPSMVTPAGVAGLRFADEADTANALVPQLRAQGADIIVVAIHEGGSTTAALNETSCAGLNGDIVPILERLDPAIDVVISGHTHQSYICDYGRQPPQRPLLLTSAGQYGTLVTDIALRFDTRTRQLVRKTAHQVIVQGEGFNGSQGRVETTALYPVFAPDADIAQLIASAKAAAEPLTQRPVGQASAAIRRTPGASFESALGNLIADAQLAATQLADKGGAQISFMHAGGLRADLVPDEQGLLRYGQLFAVQPFGNNLVVKTFSGAQLRAMLEQQFDRGSSAVKPSRVLSVSQGFSYRYDMAQPAGTRVSGLALNGVLLTDDGAYRVSISSYLASGGGNLTVFNEGRDVLGGDQDLDALEAYFRDHSPIAPPPTNRITRL